MSSPLQLKAKEVRQSGLNLLWYLQNRFISQPDYFVISMLDYARPHPAKRARVLREKPDLCAQAFLSVMSYIPKVEAAQYIATLYDDLLQEDASRVDIFRTYACESDVPLFIPLLNILNKHDSFSARQISRIITKVACWGRERMDEHDQRRYLSWLIYQLNFQNNEYLLADARCLQMMLRVCQYRFVFLQLDGLQAITNVLRIRKTDTQTQYYLLFCIWMFTFESQTVEAVTRLYDDVIPIMTVILSETAKEKLMRIILAAFKNFLQKPREQEYKLKNAMSMVRCDLMKHLLALDSRQIDDPDSFEDLTFLILTLQTKCQDLSSFDIYSSELKSGRLEWSPVHKSDRFWRENAVRLNEKNFELIKILIKLLETSSDEVVLCVAAHDLGNYVRYWPKGKTTIETLGGKEQALRLLSHADTRVRYEALVALQKIMVHNWEYLGKRLEETAADTTEEMTKAS